MFQKAKRCFFETTNRLWNLLLAKGQDPEQITYIMGLFLKFAILCHN